MKNSIISWMDFISWRWYLELCASAAAAEAAENSLATGRPEISGGCYLKTGRRKFRRRDLPVFSLLPSKIWFFLFAILNGVISAS